MADIVLTVPDDLLPQAVAALRAAYPDVTTGLDDLPAIRAVGKFWLANTLAAHEATTARDALQADVDAATAARDQAVTAAWQQAWDTVQAIP